MTKSKDNRYNKQSVIRIRINDTEKVHLKEVAKRNSVTLTDLVLAGIRNVRIRDSKKHSEILQAFELLTKAINHVGNNINQATVSIHQLRISGLRESGQVDAFNKELAIYNKLIDDFKTKLITLYE